MYTRDFFSTNIVPSNTHAFLVLFIPGSYVSTYLSNLEKPGSPSGQIRFIRRMGGKLKSDEVDLIVDLAEWHGALSF